MWQFGGCLNEIGIVIDASGAYKGKTPRCGREGVVSGILFKVERERNNRTDGVQDNIR